MAMDLSLPKNVPLYCPDCGVPAKHIHPYYGVIECWEWAGVKAQYGWYLLVSCLIVIWWPIGVVAAVLVFFKSIHDAKTAILYRCPECNKEFRMLMLGKVRWADEAYVELA